MRLLDMDQPVVREGMYVQLIIARHAYVCMQSQEKTSTYVYLRH
jgi:hypothetical protein